MGIEKDLHDNEEIIIKIHPGILNYWKYYFFGVLLIALVQVIMYQFITPINYAMQIGIGIGMAGVLFIIGFIRRHTKTYYITTMRVMQEEGVLGRRLFSTMFVQVADIELKQTLMQRILNLGDIIIDPMGGRDVTAKLWGVSRPHKVKKMLEKAWANSNKEFWGVDRE